MNPRLIVIDGKTYASVDEMPPDIRALYEEALRNASRNGMPDSFASIDPFTANDSAVVSNGTKILVNGQAYDSLDQLPPEIRAKYEQAMGPLDANRNGIPDVVEGMFNMPISQSAQPVAPISGTPSPRPSPPIPAAVTIEPVSSGNCLMIAAGIIVLGACLLLGAGGVWYFFLR